MIWWCDTCLRHHLNASKDQVTHGRLNTRKGQMQFTSFFVYYLYILFLPFGQSRTIQCKKRVKWLFIPLITVFWWREIRKNNILDKRIKHAKFHHSTFLASKCKFKKKCFSPLLNIRNKNASGTCCIELSYLHIYFDTFGFKLSYHWSAGWS